MPVAADQMSHRRAESDSGLDLRIGEAWSNRKSTPPTVTIHQTLDRTTRTSLDAYRMHSQLVKARTHDGSPCPREFSRGDIADFFSQAVFHSVLHDPIAAQELSRYCQDKACGENMAFLEKIYTYHRLLGEMNNVLTNVQNTYIGSDSREQINIPDRLMQQVTSDIEKITNSTLPAMMNTFAGAQEHVEDLIKSNIFPRFVQNQMIIASTNAITEDRERYAGLGDCFCLTDPTKPDDPIVFASDGFIDITGYCRKDVISQNCRFLDGPLTEKATLWRIRSAIENRVESVELLLNYKKNGDTFWNLLYIAPLFDADGKLAFYLRAHIDSSKTVRSHGDMMAILRCHDDNGDTRSSTSSTSRPTKHDAQRSESPWKRSPFFKSWLKPEIHNLKDSEHVTIRNTVGIEGVLLDQIKGMTIDTQAKTFYTTFSKYIFMRYVPHTSDLLVNYISSGALDLMGLKSSEGARFLSKDIFKVLAETSPCTPASTIKEYKHKVRESMRAGKAVSFDLSLALMDGKLTIGGKKSGDVQDNICSSHWTPLKNEVGKTGWVVANIIQNSDATRGA